MIQKKDHMQESQTDKAEDKRLPEQENLTSQEKQSPAEPAKKTAEEIAAEYLDDLKRCQAEFENYKKRQRAAEKDLGGYLIEKLVLSLIPVLDNFRTANLHVPSEQKDSPWVTGIQYIEKQLETVLADNGVETIAVKEGDVFDPRIHEALDQQPSVDTEVTAKQVVATILQKGYRLGNRVIRPAKVVVK